VSHFKPNYFQRRSRPQGPKSNQQIRAIDVQVIGSDGNNVGILTLKKAIELAKGEGLDLIEISPNANPPVCKIMDMGKYKYDLQKKTNIAKKKTESSCIKRN
jgi:translation initiation factor IF-3